MTWAYVGVLHVEASSAYAPQTIADYYGMLIQPLCELFVVADTASFVKNRFLRSPSDVGSV